MASIPTEPDRPAPDGKEARGRVPRSRHEEWEPASRDPAAILARQDESRVPELVPIRYERMLASPFSFFRGGAAIMAADLAKMPTPGIESDNKRGHGKDQRQHHPYECSRQPTGAADQPQDGPDEARCRERCNEQWNPIDQSIDC